jgi:hypothetical protein
MDISRSTAAMQHGSRKDDSDDEAGTRVGESEDLHSAYSYGLESRARFAGRTWEEVEEDLEREWTSVRGPNWGEVRTTVHDAWDRAESAGAIVGGVAGGSIVGEEDYWREVFSSRPSSSQYSFEDYRPAFEYGWESRRRYLDRDWDETQQTLRRHWNRVLKESTGLGWKEAKGAVKDAWEHGTSTSGTLESAAKGGDYHLSDLHVGDVGASPAIAAAAKPRGEETPAGGAPPPTYTLLKCDEIVIAEKEFDLTVGTSPEPMVESDEPLDVPDLPEYTLVVHVIADGFRLHDGESWRNELTVTRDKPYPTLVLHLTPLPQDTPIRPRLLRANYSIGGQAIGFAARSVAVVENEEFADWPLPGKQPQPGTIRIPSAADAPDLTINILRGDAGGDLLWTLESPHHGIDLPDQRLKSNIGKEPEQFARQMVDLVNTREGKAGIYNYLLGIAREITPKVPSRVWRALREAAARHPGEPPTVLILSEEAYVPWELAEMPKPLLDDSAPPFLAAQASIGRWVIRKRPGDEEADGTRERPTLPPPRKLAVSAMAVVSGVYDDPDFRPLEQAIQETAELESVYGAKKVNADFGQVRRCFEGSPEVEVLHFAVHGIYDPKGVQHGLILTDKEVLHPLFVKGTDLRRAPFVFLNACQVGSGHEILGDYAGLAEAFLYAGASGVIAPLWSVKDDIAKQIALDFYREIEGGGDPASFIRAKRARFKDSPETTSATYLAYQFFGHPRLELVGLRSQETSHE